MPYVTVIMSAYQAASTLQRAVASVRAQIFRDWELIVVNDGSTDATTSVAEANARADKRIRVINVERNQGPAAARNRAWRESRSPLLAILDADDVSMPDRISIQTDYLSRHPHVSVLGSAAHFVNPEGRFLRTVTFPSSHRELVRRRWHMSPFVHSTVVMRREFLEAMGGYQEELRLAEDYDLWVRGMRRSVFVYVNLPVPLVVYRSFPIQRWSMIKASAGVRFGIGRREGRPVRGTVAALRVLAEGAIEQTGVFAWRDRFRFANASRAVPHGLGELPT